MLSHDVLINILRPGRYIDHEWNTIKKDFHRVSLSICLCFPEVYEIGMSNLGMRILYDIINSKKHLVCERAFCPWPDLRKIMQDRELGLCSLESNAALRKFDLLGFSLDNELNYTNILAMLSLAKIPLKSRERNQDFPLIIAGGNCTLNPEPVVDFFDLFVIGEAEEVILDILEICRKFKQKYKKISSKKEKLLIELSQVPGVYVPSFYGVEYGNNVTLDKFVSLNDRAPLIIKKNYVKDLDKSLWPQNWIVPNIEIVHDRIGIEIMRGCKHQCRFCQARNYFSPLRFRSSKNIINLLKKLHRKTGYEEVSLLSLSTSDHPEIDEIIKNLTAYFKDKAVSISLPSIRPKNITGDIPYMLSLQRKTTLTFAPEAGTERLRRIINKDIDIDELFQASQDAFKAGYRRIKLYFMIGLPTEDSVDLDAIIDLSLELSNLRRKFSNQAAEINISISNFIPKPHTPFQWLSMPSIDEIKKKQQYLRSKISQNKFSRHKLNISFHNVHMSYLEAALSRGHRMLSSVIISAFSNGALFDQWKDCFNFDIWYKSFSDSGLNIEDIASRSISLDRNLPWDFIDVGISKEYLRQEFRKALT